MLVSYRCEKCRESKPAMQFDPRVESGIIVRNDTCDRCIWEIKDWRSQRLPRQRVQHAGGDKMRVMT